MLGKIVGIFALVATVFAVLTNRLPALGASVLDGAATALQITLTLCGVTCLWCGVMRVLSEAGAIRLLARLLHPLLRLFFPTAARTGNGMEEICANLSANLLGIGNAATPMALSAMRSMQADNPDPTTATADQITLAVLNTAGVTLIPANLLALRRAAGSPAPMAILVPVWIASLMCSTMALLLCTLMRLAARAHTPRR